MKSNNKIFIAGTALFLSMAFLAAVSGGGVGERSVLQASSGATSVSGAATTTVVTAPAAGKRLIIYLVWADQIIDGDCGLVWRENGGSDLYPAQLGKNVLVARSLTGRNWALPEATALEMETLDAQCEVYWHVEYSIGNI